MSWYWADIILPIIFTECDLDTHDAMHCSFAVCRNREMSWHMGKSVLSEACVCDPSILLIPFYISIKFSLLNNKANWSYLEILIPALWFYCWNLCCPFNIFWQNLSKMRKGLCSKYFSRNETFFCVCSLQQVIIPLFIYNLIIVLVTR